MTEEEEQLHKGMPESASRRNFLILVALASAVGSSFGGKVLDRLATHAVDYLESEMKRAITLWRGASHRSQNRKALVEYLQDAEARRLQAELFGLHNGRVAITTGRNVWRAVGDESRIFGASEQLPPFVMSTVAEFVEASRLVMTPVDHMADFDDLACYDSEWHMGGPGINQALRRVVENPRIEERLRYVFREFPQAPEGAERVPPGGLPRYFHQLNEGVLYTKPTTAKVDSFLVDRQHPERPIGPTYDENGRLRDSVLVVTLLPKRGALNQGRLVLVQGSYGAPQSFDLLMNSEILGRLRAELRPDPFGQAIFTVPVRYERVEKGGRSYYAEEYGTPRFVASYRLG